MLSPWRGYLWLEYEVANAKGGEKIHAYRYNQIAWCVWGDTIKKVDIICSTKGSLGWF